VLFAPHHRLDNLVAIVDFNKIQSFGRVKDVLDLDPFADKWRAFNWAVREIDGHDPGAILAACDALPLESGRPTVLIAHTTKGRGVSFMQDDLLWHYRSPDADQLARALAEVERGGCA
jgi:transketolase